VITAEALAFHEPMLQRSPDKYDPRTRKSIEMGRQITTTQYILARREMEEARAGSGRLFADADVLITPSAPGPPFELGKPGGLVFLRNSAPWNMFGLPSISVPCGFTKTGLPLAMQITARNGQDDVALGVADAYQQATDWHTRRPPEPASR
jgi:aspartyl-tRNA(Asn)/glutamyl-tRNA(Gln) amidotransferase subunit A